MVLPGPLQKEWQVSPLKVGTPTCLVERSPGVVGQEGGRGYGSVQVSG